MLGRRIQLLSTHTTVSVLTTVSFLLPLLLWRYKYVVTSSRVKTAVRKLESSRKEVRNNGP